MANANSVLCVLALVSGSVLIPVLAHSMSLHVWHVALCAVIHVDTSVPVPYVYMTTVMSVGYYHSYFTIATAYLYH